MRRALLISSLIGMIVAVIFQGSFTHIGVLLAAVAYVAMVGVFVFSGVSFGILTGKPHPPEVYMPLVIRLFAITSATILSGGTGYAIRAWQVSAVEKYVHRATPVLDEIKKRDDRYPAVLPEESLGRPPYLLRSPNGYSSNGVSFHFEYPAAFRLFRNTWVFRSKYRRWVCLDGEAYGTLEREEQRP